MRNEHNYIATISADIFSLVEEKITRPESSVSIRIASAKEVVAVYDHTGYFDTLVIARFKSRRSMDTFLKKIKTYDFVERTETQLVLNVMKER